MKHYSKKMNRGLVLGGACLIFLVIYLVAGQITFSKEKPRIESTIEQFIELIEHCNQSSLSLNEVRTQLDSYWTSSSTTLSCRYSDMIMALHNYFSSTQCKVDHFESTVGQYRVTQTGTNAALLECTYSFTADLPKLGNYLLINKSLSVDDLIIQNASSLYRLSGTVKVKAEFIYEKHKWMIIGIDTSVLTQDIQSISQD